MFLFIIKCVILFIIGTFVAELIWKPFDED